MDSVECTNLGLKSGWIRDRILMVVKEDGPYITARKFPHMIHVILLTIIIF